LSPARTSGAVHRKLSESARQLLDAPPKAGRPVGARKRAPKLTEAVEQLSVALAAEDVDAASRALRKLRRAAASPAKESGSRADPSRGRDSSAKPPGPVSSSGPGTPSNDGLRTERKRRQKARQRLAKLERATMVERVCREEQVPESVAVLCARQLRERARLARVRCARSRCRRSSSIADAGRTARKRGGRACTSIRLKEPGRGAR